ncbi:protein SEH1 [Solanum lycopersicum]|uniref:Anaphase-promoting complex subunit 4 WD40 domain-containing protein n=1 Tax=Solanum lycopersicum TaxID=4081 RepID=A0A3Q7HUB5_SOLLC|nr:protein SEH1 [Solanum lycopersicum]
MDKAIIKLEEGTTCTAWNYSGHRLAAGSTDGTLFVFDSTDPASSVFSGSSKFKVHESSIVKVVWAPPEYGDVVACICADGSLLLWEEVVEDSELLQWKLCKCFDRISSLVLDVQFGVSQTSLKLVAAYSDGQVKVFELLDPFELKNWQLQAEFQNVIESVSKFGNVSCRSASIAWNPLKGEIQQSSFVLGFDSDTPHLNSSKVWEFDQDHQRWLPVAELALPADKADPVSTVAWAPNIGRPYELIAVATCKEIALWHVGSNPDSDGRLSVEKVAMLSTHDSEVWQMEWDMSGMTLATTGSDGVVRLWQCNLNGVWHEQATLQPTS